jgi:hypothetical protein
MKLRLLVALAFVVISLPVRAADVSLKFDDNLQRAVSNLPAVFDQCVAALTLRGDANLCRSISILLTGISGEIRNQQELAAKTADAETKKMADEHKAAAAEIEKEIARKAAEEKAAANAAAEAAVNQPSPAK